MQVMASIADCKDMDDWEGHCQVGKLLVHTATNFSPLASINPTSLS